MIVEYQCKAIAECALVGIHIREYSIDRLRNYEIENDLNRLFSNDYVISEWCPFDGFFCDWSNYCLISELEALKSDENKVHVISVGYNWESFVGLVNAKINERKATIIKELA
jgi:hypothetical protein